MDSTLTYSCLAAGKPIYSPKTQTAISYERLDRDAIISSRQDAATHRSRHSRSTSLPKIATGRSTKSAKKLWQDYENIEVKSKVQRENEKTPEVPPLRVPKNPHSLYKHAVRSVKPYHILHSPSDYGQDNHQLGQLYAQVTYLSNAVRNCDGSASYRGMCKRQQSYRGNGNDPLRLHWPSSDDKTPVPRLLLPVMPGTNTKWYSWKVDTPREDSSPRGGGDVRGYDKRYASSAPVSRSLDFIERYSKKHRVVFTVDDDGGQRSKCSKDVDSKSRDGHLSVKSIEGSESLASSSLSSIMRYDANKFKLSEDEGVEGKAIFLTQTETSVEKVQADLPGDSQHGSEETKRLKQEDATSEKDEKKRASEGDDKEIQVEAIRIASKHTPEDELDIVAKANVATDPQQDLKSTAPLKAENEATSKNLHLSDGMSDQEDVNVAKNVQSADPMSDNPHNIGNTFTDIKEIFQSKDVDPITVRNGIVDEKDYEQHDSQQTVQSEDNSIKNMIMPDSQSAEQNNPAIPHNSHEEQYDNQNTGDSTSEVHTRTGNNPTEADQPRGVHVPHTEQSIDAHEVHDQVKEVNGEQDDDQNSPPKNSKINQHPSTDDNKEGDVQPPEVPQTGEVFEQILNINEEQ